MRLSSLVFPLLGLALLALVLAQADLAQLLTHVAQVGWRSFALICALFLVYFAADVANWQAALPSLPRSSRWFARLWLVRMIGDAYNNVTPTAALGGEAVKGWLMKRRYDVSWRVTGAGIVIARTSTMFALILFAAIGVLLVWRRPGLDAAQQGYALATFAVLVIGTGAIFLVQYLELSSRLARRVGASRWGERLLRVVGAVEDLDRRLVAYYREHRAGLAASIGWALVAWVLGAVEAWLVLHALGLHTSFADVWIMEAFVQTVRAASFFIPAGLGAQEAAIYVMVDWLAGAPAAGVATALVRRAREVLWLAVSLLAGSLCAVHARTLDTTTLRD